MEDSDRDLIKSFIERDRQLKRLYQQHLSMEDRLAELRGRLFLTDREELETKDLKRRKLRGRDQMMALLRKVRSAVDTQRAELRAD